MEATAEGYPGIHAAGADRFHPDKRVRFLSGARRTTRRSPASRFFMLLAGFLLAAGLGFFGAAPAHAASEGDIRLVPASGEPAHKGRVEIYHDNEWGGVCDDFWGQADAKVVCRQLGYQGAIDVIRTLTGPADMNIWLDNVDCAGSEQTLIECEAERWGPYIPFRCSRGEFAGVICQPGKVTPNKLTVNEGETATYTIELLTEPTGDVTVTFEGFTGTDVTVDPTELTFTTANHDTPQTVTVTAADDDDLNDDIVRLRHNSSGGGYDSIRIPGVRVKVVDDDDRGVLVQPDTLLTLLEQDAAGATYTVTLQSAPSGDVTVTPVLPDGTDLAVDPTSLTFTMTNWETPQTVTLTAGDDDDMTDDTETVTHTISGGGYGSISVPSVSVSVEDNDTPGVTITETSVTVAEGDANGNTYAVVLTGEPSADVTLTISGHSGTDLTVNPASLTFTSSNWDTPQVVRVTAGEDTDMTDDTETLTHSASGGGYTSSLSLPSVAVRVQDNDTAVNPMDGSLRLVAGISHRVGRLEVYHDNRWGPVCDDLFYIQEAKVACRQLGYTDAEAYLPWYGGPSNQFWLDNVNCDGTEDRLTDCSRNDWGDHNCISYESVGVRCTDETTVPAAILSSRKISLNEGTSALYAVKLGKIPSTSVTISIGGTDDTDVTVEPASLTFTASNWNTFQNVTVSAAADTDTTDDMVTLTHSAAGGEYASVTLPDLRVRVREGTQGALTAAFTSAPEEHDGNTKFTLRLEFSKDVRTSEQDMRNHVFEVTGGRIVRARKVNNRKDLWNIRFKPDGYGAVGVTFGPSPACGTTGAVCTRANMALSGTISANIPGPPWLSVADAQVQEAEGATLDFVVTLSRAVSRTVTVDYATSGGSATAGSDFTATSGTLTFAAGDTSKTVSVPVLNDTVDDDGEMLTLTLSNASGAYIVDNQATGTITNTDPMPRAWLARFGRAAAEHVVDALGERLRGAPDGQVTLGGRRLDLGGGPLLAGGAVSVPSLTKSGPGNTLPAPMRVFGEDVGRNFPEKEREVSLRELMLASSFHLASAENAESDSRWSLWGRGARSGFEGAEEDLTLEGDVTTATLGVDYERARWLVGVALSRSSGDGTFRAGGTCQTGCAGEVESALTGLYPYARYRVSERLSLWGVLGHGQGDLTLSPEGANAMETDIEMSMAAAGARGVVLPAAKAGGFELALRADLLATSTSSDAAAGLAGAEAETSRIRLLLEGSRDMKLADGVLTPSLELGLRYDGGDAETGGGLEAGGSLRYTAKRLMFELSARGLLAHAESEYEEWGVSGSIRLAPGGEGRGLSMSLASAWGADSGGAERLWSERLGPASLGGFDPDARLDAEVAYGLDVPRGLLTPYTGLSHSGSADIWRAGARWRLGPAFDVSLEASLTRPAGDEEPESGVLLRGSRRW